MKKFLLSTYYVPINVWVAKPIPIVITLFSEQKQEFRKQIWFRNPPHMKMTENVLPYIKSELRNHILYVK